jgi:tRNA (guanine10-N2)-dimethyltransferase
MRTAQFLFELSGEHPDLPAAEVLSTAGSECGTCNLICHALGMIVLEFDENRLHDVTSRLGLCHRAGRYLGTCDPVDVQEFTRSLEIPEGSISVRTKKYQGNTSSTWASELSRKVGGTLARERRVDLENPDVKIRILVSDDLHFFIVEETIDRAEFERRKVGLRPFFSPISLHPRFARALVNLTGVARGDTILDPFCGTGGILIEASLMDMRSLGSDISEEMVQGCRENMAFFGVEPERLERGDVGDIEQMFGKVHAIATDPPYGRSTTTMREELDSLYGRMMGSFERTLVKGGKVGLVLPMECRELAGLRVVEQHLQRVHRSLTRHYCVLARRPGP